MISIQEAQAIKNGARRHREDADTARRAEQEKRDAEAIKEDLRSCDVAIRVAAREEKSCVQVSVSASSIPKLQEVLSEFRVSRTNFEDDLGFKRPALIIRWDNEDGGWR